MTGHPFSVYTHRMTRSVRRLLIVAAIALLLAGAAVAAGSWAKGVESEAVAGKAQAEAGVRSLAAMDATAAASQFASATRSFTSAKRGLGPGWFGGLASAIPWAGRQYAAASALTEIGLDGCAAGAELSRFILDASASTDATDSASRLGSILVRGHSSAEVALASLADAADRASRLATEGLTGSLARQVVSAQSAMRRLAPVLDQVRAFAPLLSYLASRDHRILVVSQDGAELRPTGGFAGSFGIIDVGPAGVRLEAYHDVYTLPMPSPRVTPPLGALMHSSFSFRDANWWIDFPTSARSMLGLWSRQAQAPVDGIIAIDTVAIGNLLAATGPVTVPGDGIFTSSNLLARLLYLVEIKRGGQTDRKNVLAALASELEKRLMGSGLAELAKSASAIVQSADAKHIQAYLGDPRAQAVVDARGWSGRVAPPVGTTDVLAVSNAMNLGSKANAAMRKAIGYEVALRPDRSADTTLTLGYAATAPYPKELPKRFRNWLRVYRAPGTVFLGVHGRVGMAQTVVEFGFPAEVRTFNLLYGQRRTETLTARVPDAIRAGVGPAARDSVAYYRLYLVRQADIEDVLTTLRVTVPPGWRVTDASARFIASGATAPLSIGSDRVSMTVPLRGDLDLQVRISAP